ncbi:hypothetical protein LZ587_18885, partial [Klebsiella pneumoniae]|nr:hypothetical protein [Klebsiella pneumoniae]
KKIGPDPRNFNQRVSLGRNDLLIRTFPNRRQGGVYVPLAERAGEIVQASFVDVPWKVLCSGITGRSHLYESEYAESS